MHAVLSNGSQGVTPPRLHYPRITLSKFAQIRDQIIAPDVPNSVDLVPLFVESGNPVSAGGQLSSLSYVVHNYSAASFSGPVTVDVYLSTNDNISESDTLIQTHEFSHSFSAKSSVQINVSNPPTIPASVSAGNYYIGVIIRTPDAILSNNDTDGFDAQPITVIHNPGPQVVSGNVVGDGAHASGVDITFSEPIDSNSFGTNDAALSGPLGPIPISSVSPLGGNAYRISFPQQNAPGVYTIEIGPNIADVGGSLMNQDGDNVNGESTDAYVATFELIAADQSGPRVLGMTTVGDTHSASAVDLNFDEPIDTTTLTTNDISLTGPSGTVAITNVTATGGNNYRISFPMQTAPGSYTLTVGPNVTDVSGNLMNQDGDGVNGEASDHFVDTFQLISADAHGPVVVSMSVANTPLFAKTAELTFDEPIDISSFSIADVTINGPGGGIPVSGITPSGGNTYRVDFPTQTTGGFYSVQVGPNITDLNGNLMNQDGDATNGEANDLFAGTFQLGAGDQEGPMIVAMSVSGAPHSVEHLEVTFDEPLDVTTFTTADVMIDGPNGPVPVTGILAQAANQYRIDVPTLAAAGVYNVEIGPQIADTSGNLMNQDGDAVNGEIADAFVDSFELGTDSTTYLLSLASPGRVTASDGGRLSVDDSDIVQVERRSRRKPHSWALL